MLLNIISDSIIKNESKIFNLSYIPDKSKPMRVYKNSRELNKNEFKIYSTSRKLEILTNVEMNDEIIVEYKVAK